MLFLFLMWNYRTLHTMQADISETGQGVTGEAILLANPEGWVLVFRVESIQSFLQAYPNFLNSKTKTKIQF